MDIIRFRTARDIQLDCAQQVVIMIDEGYADFDRFANTGIGEMLGHICAVRFVCEPFPDLDEYHSVPLDHHPVADWNEA